MGCNHERLRTVGDRVFCCECKEELPLSFLMAKNGKNSAEKTAPASKTKTPGEKENAEKGRLKAEKHYTDETAPSRVLFSYHYARRGDKGASGASL